MPSTPAQDVAGFALGTTTTPDLYASQSLASSLSWSLLQQRFTATDTTTRVTLRSQYPADPQPSYFDAMTVTLGGGGLNPAEAIRTVIETFLPTASVNAQAFLEAQATLLAWQFSGSSAVVTDVDSLLERLAQQCGSLLLKDPEDQYTLIPLVETRPTVFEFATHNIITPTMSRESSPQDAIVTEVYVHYGVRTGGNSSASDFTSVAYVTPFATSITDAAGLQTKCRVARAVYGKDQRLDLYCEWIQDVTTAELLVAWAVERYTTSPDVVRFSTWLDALPVTMGSMIAVRHPVLQYGGARALAEVIGWQFQPQQMQVELTARLLPYAQNILDLTLEDVTVAMELLPEETGPVIDTFDLTTLDADAKGFSRGISDGQYLYLVPYLNAAGSGTFLSQAVRYDTTMALDDPDAYVVFDLTTLDTDAKGFAAGACDGRYVYMAGNRTGLGGFFGGTASLLLRYDTESGLDFDDPAAWESFDAAGLGTPLYGFQAAISHEQYVYFLGAYSSGGTGASYLLRYDTTQDFTDSAAYTVSPDLYGWSSSTVRQIFAAVMADDVLLMSGRNGSSVSYVVSYDTTASFTSTGSYAYYDLQPTVLGGTHHTYRGMATDGTSVYLAPTDQGSASVLSAVRYDPSQALDDPAAYTVMDLWADLDLQSGFYAAVSDGTTLWYAPNRNFYNASQGLVPRYTLAGPFDDAASWDVTIDLTTVLSSPALYSDILTTSAGIFLVPGFSYNASSGASIGWLVRIT
jgi:hypothetical protein